MGKMMSIMGEELPPIFEKMKSDLDDLLRNADRRTVATALLIGFGVYIGGSFIAKCYHMHRVRKSLAGIPNKPNAISGNLSDFPGPGPNAFGWVNSKVSQFDKWYQFWLGPFFPMVSLCHPDTAKIILKSSESKYTKAGSPVNYLRDWLVSALSLQFNQFSYITVGIDSVTIVLKKKVMDCSCHQGKNGSEIVDFFLTPAFHFEILKPYLKIYSGASDTFLDKMSTLGQNGKESVPIYAFVSLATLDIILRCAFSYEGDIQSQGKNDPYVAAVMKLTETAVQRMFSPILQNRFLFYLSSVGREHNRAAKYVHKVADDVIQRRQKYLEENPNAPQKRYLDFLDILLAAKDDQGRGLTEEEIRNEVDTFLFEGHDTTASGISWTLYELAQHPEAQDEAYHEVMNVLGDSSNGGIEWSDLSRLPYLTQCIKESMRVHPPVPFIYRQLSQDTVIEGCTIPIYTNMEVNIYGIHHNPAAWGEDHMEFKPERFHPDNMKNRDAYDFIPFSAGSRNCIGQSFALNEERVVIAKVLQMFELSVDPTHVVQKHPEAVTRPTNDIKLFFKPRK